MELDILFYIAIGVFYLITQLLGSRKRKPQPGPTSPPARGPQKPSRETQRAQEAASAPTGQPATGSRSSEMEDALREIRMALGWEKPEPAPAPAPPPAPRTHEPERPLPELSPNARAEPIPRAKIESTGRKEVPPSRIESTKTGGSRSARPRTTIPVPTRPERPIETTTWDALPPETSIRAKPTLIESEWVGSERANRDRLLDVRRRLHNPDSARDAFIMAEIFARRGRRL